MDERNEHSEPIDERGVSSSIPSGAGPVSPPEHLQDVTPVPEPDIPVGIDDLDEADGPPTGELPPSLTQPWTPLPSWRPTGPEGAAPGPGESPPYSAGPYGGGPYGGGPYGGPYGGGPYGGGPYGGGPYGGGPFGPGPAQDEPKRPRGKVIAAGVGAALLLIGAGAGLAVALSSGPSPRVTTSAVNDNSSPHSGASLHTSRIARSVDPAVVDINTNIEYPGGTAQAAGTGMIVSSNGYIVTNNHVVEDATSIQVSIAGRGKFTASFVGASPTNDVAVIKVQDVQGLPTVTFGNSSTLAVGDPVVAIGNALGLGGAPTVTTGTVSALGRAITASDSTGSSEHLTGMIQTDAPIEPGNSGGPLVDAAGHVIGMDTAAASADGSGSSLGFALPINRVVALATQIEHHQHGADVVLGLPAFLGIDGQNVALFGQASSNGVNIVDVVPGTPAAKAGIQSGDVILKFDGVSTPTIQALSGQIRKLRPGDVATVTYESQFGTRTVTVHLAPGPAA